MKPSKWYKDRFVSEVPQEIRENEKVCPYCGSDRISYSFTGSNYFCLDCEKIFVEPRRG